MSDRFESILDEAISALQAGVPLEEVLAEVPEYAAQLRPLLYAASVLADPDPALVPEEQKAALQAKYLAQAAELPPVQPTFADKVRAVTNIARRRLTPRAVLNDAATVIITVLLTLSVAALLLIYLAQDTLPGDLLYGVKQASEQTQLFFTTDEARRAELEAQFNQRRLDELNRLSEQGRVAVVQFWGMLQTKSESLWVVEGHTVFLPNDARIIGNPQEGDSVEVVGLLKTNGVLVADTITKTP